MFGKVYISASGDLLVLDVPINHRMRSVKTQLSRD